MDPTDFPKFIATLREGDGGAASRFVRRHEPYLRRIIQMRLIGHRPRRRLDSVDAGQSALAGFFRHVASGRYASLSPEGAKKLLATMGINKLVSKIRREPDPASTLADSSEPAAPGPTPAEHVADRDLLRAIRARLSERERWLLERRAERLSWSELARECGSTPDALRMLHARAVARIRLEFADPR